MIIDEVRVSDVVLVGAGIAGLAAARRLEGRRVTLLTKATFGSGGSSPLAQGGVAAAVGECDSPAEHAVDTMACGAGLNSQHAVDILTQEGPDRVHELEACGVQFDHDADGALSLGREAAHSQRRILHSTDATGAEMVRALTEVVRTLPNIEVVERIFVADLLVVDGRAAGVLGIMPDGRCILFAAPAVVLATGGIGQVYRYTTNPKEATGDGLAMALRGGASLSDIEFVQFHPTAIETGGDPLPLATEALRGEGARLVDEQGVRIMLTVHALGDLAPRDVVARAIWRVRLGGQRTFLDATELADRVKTRFPTVFQACLQTGVDPRTQRIPVVPAAHFHMGGVVTDEQGRTSLPGLWACGEVAATGVHGANRLASNSLLEGLVFGTRSGDDVRAFSGSLPPLSRLQHAASCQWADAVVGEDPKVVAEIRQTMWENVGLVRDRTRLRQAATTLRKLQLRLRFQLGETANLLAVARSITLAATRREESRGAHYRSDFPHAKAERGRHQVLTQQQLA